MTREMIITELKNRGYNAEAPVSYTHLTLPTIA